MSLFPAYAQGACDSAAPQEYAEIRDAVVNEKSSSPTPELEASLLASDEEEQPPAAPSEAQSRQRTPPPPQCDFYCDRARDTGNLRVSTLYYPGRPDYSWRDECTLGGVKGGVGRRRRRLKRYYEEGVAPPTPLHDEAAARAAALRRMLADTPDDVELWLRLIHFQEACVGLGDALEAAERATSQVPRSAALRSVYHRLARAHLPRPDYLAKLRDMLANEKCPSTRVWVWVQLIRALSSSAAECSAEGVAAAAKAAITDCRHHAPAYPQILLEYGMFLRAGGLWELLVLLIELVGSMSFPAEVTFPPAKSPAEAEAEAERERELQRAEDEISASGLPLAARWARLERARAAVHWRPATSSEQMQLDPQRAPLGSDVSELLQPCAPAQALNLCCTLLRLAKVPFLPGTGALPSRSECFEGALPVIYASRRLPRAHPARAEPPALAAAAAMLVDPPHYFTSNSGTGALPSRLECFEGALPVIYASRRLPRAHPARAHPPALAAAAAMLVDPPHYFTANSGFQAWVCALWDACCGWLQGRARAALLGWRMRWLHALLMTMLPGSAEARRIRGMARAALRAFGGSSPLPFAQFARIEAHVNGMQAGVKAAWLSVRAAANDPSCDTPTRIYCARVLLELAGDSSLGVLAGAVLGRPPPDHIDDSPPPGLMEEALRQCDMECQRIEKELWNESAKSSGEDSDSLVLLMLPGCGEWAAARVLLSPPAAQHALLQRALANPPPPDCSPLLRRYWEVSACALAGAAHARGQGAATARALAQYAPHNAYLAAAGGGAPLWAGRLSLTSTPSPHERDSEPRAWGALLPTLLPAVHTNTEEQWRRAAAVAARNTAAGPALAAAALELNARTTAANTERILYDALDQHPHHKWVYVRGSCWSPAGCELADLLLARQLRLHALPVELGDADTA